MVINAVFYFYDFFQRGLCFLWMREIERVLLNLGSFSYVTPFTLHSQVLQYQPVKYEVLPLSPLSRHRLSELERETKTLMYIEIPKKEIDIAHRQHTHLPTSTPSDLPFPQA